MSQICFCRVEANGSSEHNKNYISSYFTFWEYLSSLMADVNSGNMSTE